MRKTLITGALLTAVTASAFAPVSALGAESHAIVSQVASQGMETQTVSGALKRMGSYSALIQAYGLVILQQPNVKVTALPSLTLDQQLAKTEVKEWIDDYNPALIQLNQNVVRFNGRFANYYPLLTAAGAQINSDAQAKADVLSGLRTLQRQVQQTQGTLDQTVVDVKDFSDSLNATSRGFSTKVEKAVGALDGAKLREEIKTLEGSIQKSITTILEKPGETIKGAISVAKHSIEFAKTASESKKIDFTAVEGLSGDIANLADDTAKAASGQIAEDRLKLQSLSKTLSENQLQTTALTLIEDQLVGFSEVVNRQSLQLNTFVTDWKTLNTMLSQVITNITAGTYTDSAVLVDDLAKIKQFNDTLNKQAKQFESFSTQVQIVSN